MTGFSDCLCELYRLLSFVLHDLHRTLRFSSSHAAWHTRGQTSSVIEFLAKIQKPSRERNSQNVDLGVMLLHRLNPFARTAVGNDETTGLPRSTAFEPASAKREDPSAARLAFRRTSVATLWYASASSIAQGTVNVATIAVLEPTLCADTRASCSLHVFTHACRCDDISLFIGRYVCPSCFACAILPHT